MKYRQILYLALVLFVAAPAPTLLRADELDKHQQETNNLYRPECTEEDPAFTAIGTSMMGWGIGLAIGIALLTGLMHQSD